ncbi:hypothetical protein SAMN02745866_02937 [Alteromonadaceae bacterium Bs31]|nr:hypothetical protein SAMN02745866_02937 [Alteromonadaceae bacterium Bs31]
MQISFSLGFTVEKKPAAQLVFLFLGAGLDSVYLHLSDQAFITLCE